MNPPLAREDVERFRDLVRARFGLDFDDAKLEHLAEVLCTRIDRFGQGGADLYLDRLAADRRGDWGALAECLTVAETYFFRYRDHFRAFTELVLPECVTLRPPDRPVRILSAGAASGEEAYSLAILALETRLATSAQDLAILGIDINARTLERAVLGTYSQWSLRETKPDLRDRYFTIDGRNYRLRDEVRTMVCFEERNLVADDPAFWRPGSFDVVFCRNVLMYMTQDAMRAVVGRIARALRPGGYLFLGHAETLRGMSQDFHLRHTHDTFYYARRGLEAHAEPSQPAAAKPSPAANGSGTPALSVALGLGDSSWVEAIARASERVAAIVERAPIPRVDPRSASASTRPSLASTDRQEVLQLIREERFAEALAALRPLTTGAGQDLEAQLLRAIVLTNSGRFREAELACRELLAIDSLSAGAHYLTALCREHEGDRAGAMDRDQTASYLAPGFVMPRLHLGLLERRAGHFERAGVELRKALALLPAEDESRILLFGGGFGREALTELCRAELRRCGGEL